MTTPDCRRLEAACSGPKRGGKAWRQGALAAALILSCISNAWPATITWDGGGGNVSWQTASNWSGDVLPGVNDDVVIDVGGSLTVTSSASVTIRSLQCSNDLSLSTGTFRVLAGNSQLQGRLFVTGNPVLSASGTFTSFALPGATNVDGVSLEALSGARLSLPNLTDYNKGSSCFAVTWQAAGSNSVLETSGLATLNGATCASMTVQATGGGTVLLTNLISVTEGVLVVLADGTNSLVDLAGLQQSPGTLRTVSFEARNRGAISLPQFPGGRNVTVALKFTGTLPIAQLKELNGFTVIGTNADFSGLTNLTTGSVTINSNAVVTATNLVSHDQTAGCSANSWQVTGAGSVLDFSHLVTLTGASCGFQNVQAIGGGIVNLSNLTTVTEGIVNFTADGSNSVVNLSALQQCSASLRVVSFEVDNSGVILMPLFPGSPNVSVSLATGGILPVAQLRDLWGFTVTGMNVNFPGLTNLTGGDVTVNGGAAVATPSLVSHSQSFCSGNTWLVSGAGSVLDLSHLTALTGPGCGVQTLSAKAGGLMILSNLPTVLDGTVTFFADGSNSVMNLSALAQTAGSRTVTFSAANAGTIQVPLLAGNSNVFVTLQSGGVFPVAQMRRLLGFTVTGMTVNFSALTNLAAGNVTVNGAGTVTAPNLTQHSENIGCVGNTWLATGAGSVLDFSNLTNLVGGSCGLLNVSATAGGRVLLGNLAAIGEGTLAFLADGTNSLVDLHSLTQSLSVVATVSFEARNAGTLAIPVLQGGQTLAVTIKSGGALDTPQLRLLKTLVVSGTSLNLPGITNLFAGDLTVDQGAVLSLPNLFNHNQSGGCVGNSWTVSGAGSQLDLSSLTNIVGSSCGSLAINALAGGSMNLSNLVKITDGTIAFLADGTNSRTDLSRLQSSLAISRPVSFESRNAGAITMPQMAGGATVAIAVKTNGFMSVSQFTRLNSVIVLGTNVVLSSLTNIDGGSFAVSNNATVIAPVLATYAKVDNCIPAVWIALGTNSVLNLPALVQLAGGGACVPLDVRAVNGGQILFGGLTNILSGSVYFLSSSPGSLIDLHALINFLNASAQSRLTATNSGALLLNPQPLVLSGVTLNIAIGTPGIPATSLAPTNLVLHGLAWHAYQVERRDVTSPLNLFVFARRVPLTNDFQIIGLPAPANVEFRVTEFLPDPYYLDLTVQAGAVVMPIFYAPAIHTFEVLTTTNLAPVVVWTNYATLVMTNTFRIFPPEPPALPQRYFKVNPL